MAKRRPSGDGMVRKREDGRWEGRVHEHPELGHVLSASTIRRIHTMLHSAFEDAVQAHVLPRNPAEGLALPKADPAPRRVLTDQELDTFMKTIETDPIWYDFFYTELTTGLRRGEICGLMWSDFDANAGTLQARQEVSSSPWIFPNPFRPEQPASPDAAYRQLKILLKRANLPNIPFHNLRHSRATLWIAQGMEPNMVARLLGHSDLKMLTKIYDHTSEETLRSALLRTSGDTDS